MILAFTILIIAAVAGVYIVLEREAHRDRKQLEAMHERYKVSRPETFAEMAERLHRTR